jgi:LmbE family N-acetylglucosaminyl deacetylase
MKPTPKFPSPSKSKSQPPDEPPPLLVFGAHPDDIEFGCGGVVARETLAGRTAHLVVCSRGEAGTRGRPAERVREARRAAGRLGASIEFLTLDGDAHLSRTVAHALTLAAVLRRRRPGIVLAPTPTENQHPDHARLGQLVRDAARLARYGGVAELRRQPAHAIGQLLFYAVNPEGEPAGERPILIDVSAPAVLEAWRAAMAAHGSQTAGLPYLELQLTRARVAGLRAGRGHAIGLYPSDPLVFDSLAALGSAARVF